MNRGRAAVVLIAAVLGARPAGAAERVCPAMLVEADAKVRDRWPEASRQVRAAFSDRDDLDACARVALAFADGAIAVTVVLPDGRSATRTVSQPGDVALVLQALLLVPERLVLPPASPPPPLPAQNPPPVAAAVAARRAPLASPAPDRAGLAVELSLSLGARVGDGHVGAGVGALSFVDLAGWLVGLEARADSYQSTALGSASGAFAAALLLGHRFRSGTLSFDLFGGPALALSSESREVSAPVLGNERMVMPLDGDESPARLRLGLRLNFRARSVLRTFVGVDGDFGQKRDDFARPVGDSVRLPAWTLGLTLGATVGTL